MAQTLSLPDELNTAETSQLVSHSETQSCADTEYNLTAMSGSTSVLLAISVCVVIWIAVALTIAF